MDHRAVASNGLCGASPTTHALVKDRVDQNNYAEIANLRRGVFSITNALKGAKDSNDSVEHGLAILNWQKSGGFVIFGLDAAATRLSGSFSGQPKV